MLEFNPDWRFDSPGEISEETYRGLCELMRPIINPRPKFVYEHFKEYFAPAAGSTAYPSSSASWAETDLDSHISVAKQNAALFIEAFYDACESLPDGYPKPRVARINRVLAQTDSGWTIQPPHLIRLNNSEPVQVQEIIWLLETVSTVFEGVETGEGVIEGTYFNAIISDLRQLERGTTLEQTLNWIRTLHGFLSSPSGGGIRHGATLSAATCEIEPNEARL
jgi:hypothetical protein